MRMKRMRRNGRGCVEFRSVWSDSEGLGGRAGWWGPWQVGQDSSQAASGIHGSHLQGQESLLATAVGETGTIYRLWKFPSRTKYFH